MVWTSANGPKCPVSPEDRGEEPDAGNVLSAWREARNNVDIAEHNLAVAIAHLNRADLEVRKAMAIMKSPPLSRPKDK